MFRKKAAALVLSLTLAVGLCPALALAQTGGADLQAAPSQLTTQAKNLSDCTLKWTGSNFAGGPEDNFQFFYAKDKTTPVKPTFKLYYKGREVPKSAYSAKYVMSYWDDSKDRDVTEEWDASNLIPSGSPIANEEDMATEYRLVIEAKGGDYVGVYEENTVVAVDAQNIGRNTDVVLGGTKNRYAINPMNANYYVIPQAKAKATLNSLALYAGRAPGEGTMIHKGGTKIAPKYYSVSYYKAKKDAVTKNISPASGTKTGGKLSSVPTEPGSYVCIIEGKKPYYGKASYYFDIKGSISNVSIAKVKAQKENGKYVEPALTVKYKGTKLKEGVDYDVAFENNLKDGTATATITGTKVLTNTMGIVDSANEPRYFTGSKKVTFKIKNGGTWKDNPMKASAKTASVDASTLQRKGDQTIAASKVFAVSKAQGQVTFTKESGPSILSVSKNGTVTVAQHAGFVGKGKTFSMKVKVLAAGNSKYYAKAKILTVKVAIK